MEAPSKTKRSRSNSLPDSPVQPNVRPRLDDHSESHELKPGLESKSIESSPTSPEPKNVSSHEPENDVSEETRDDDERLTTTKETFIPSGGTTTNASSSSTAVYSNGDWQAVYDPQQAAYYFVNCVSGETTWINPFISSSCSKSEINQKEINSTNELGGIIDPELAYLEPQTISSRSGGGGGNGQHQHPPTFTARFNSRTGKFESDLNHDPNRVSQYARARTQAGAYFDVEGWEKSLEQSNGRITGTSRDRQAEAIKNGKKLSKVEIAKFKEKKMEKKSQRQRAWLAG